jgi:hypothetical protein
VYLAARYHQGTQSLNFTTKSFESEKRESDKDQPLHSCIHIPVLRRAFIAQDTREWRMTPNVRIAKQAKKLGILDCYYVAISMTLNRLRCQLRSSMQQARCVLPNKTTDSCCVSNTRHS